MATVPDALPASVEFTVEQGDVEALRTLREGRMRFIPLEMVVHLLAGAAATIVALVAFLSRRTDRLWMHLAILLVAWGAAWAYVALWLFRRSPESRAWFEKVRQGTVANKGACRLVLTDRGMTLFSAGAARDFMPNDLDDVVHDGERFFARTVRGEVIIVPSRAFPSRDAWIEFTYHIRTRGTEGLDRSK